MPPSMPPLRGHAGPRKSREGGGGGARGPGAGAFGGALQPGRNPEAARRAGAAAVKGRRRGAARRAREVEADWGAHAVAGDGRAGGRSPAVAGGEQKAAAAVHYWKGRGTDWTAAGAAAGATAHKGEGQKRGAPGIAAGGGAGGRGGLRLSQRSPRRAFVMGFCKGCACKALVSGQGGGADADGRGCCGRAARRWAAGRDKTGVEIAPDACGEGMKVGFMGAAD
jgi:hypothetical protein